ncbi:nitrogenase molybdenum-iron protein beta chain [Rubrivivax gelatinosus]|uniref:nitrogenase component 1 n=2 Tax=Rubrivivax gelatinosus TaxID=28068 RepID=UPI0018CB356D|nr:nitrogenase component 1 [Rubrivivax gelatinosus]MBG6082415.1 nitrogenase molybdenum-iron protein beta chain [Rubrivivax gelatinosus]
MAALHERNGCALQGAVALLQAVDGVVPVLHANAGCGAALGRGRPLPSTALLEKQVVFGGTSRLREQLKNAVQVQAGTLFGVLAGCVPEVIGDDVPAMLKEAREQRFPAFSVAVPGFGGHGWSGHAAAARALLEHAALAAPSPEAVPADVNLLGLVPGLDPDWEADLDEVAAVLAEAGLVARRLAGEGTAAWQAAARSRASLVLSPWGETAADWLEREHRVLRVDLGWRPVGSADAALLLERLGEALALDDARVQGAAARLHARQRRALQAAAERGWLAALPERFAVAAPSATAVGLVRFVAGTLGLEPTAVVVTDQPPPERRPALEAAAGVPLHYGAGSDEVATLLAAAGFDILLASALEAPVAADAGVPLVEVATPLERRPLVRSHAGVRGALALVEDLLAAPAKRR